MREIGVVSEDGLSGAGEGGFRGWGPTENHLHNQFSGVSGLLFEYLRNLLYLQLIAIWAPSRWNSMIEAL